jgi:hypothetical protein
VPNPCRKEGKKQDNSVGIIALFQHRLCLFIYSLFRVFNPRRFSFVLGTDSVAKYGLSGISVNKGRENLKQTEIRVTKEKKDGKVQKYLRTGDKKRKTY